MGHDKEQHSDSFFVVKGEDSLLTLPDWLRRRVFTSYRDTLTDKNGKPMVGLRDGGDHSGLILCVAADLLPRVVELVKPLCVPKT